MPDYFYYMQHVLNVILAQQFLYVRCNRGFKWVIILDVINGPSPNTFEQYTNQIHKPLRKRT